MPTLAVRPPRSPDFRNPTDVERWTRELRDYLDRVYTDLVTAAGDLTTKQPLDGTLTGLSGLDATAGLVEQTGPDAFGKRAIGVGTALSVPTRGDADGRYVQGPASATDNALARFDAATGRLLQNSVWVLDDSGNLVINGDVTVSYATDRLTISGGDLRMATGTRFDTTDSQTTVGAAGAAAALPANPTGYALIRVNGTDRAFPFYAAA